MAGRTEARLALLFALAGLCSYILSLRAFTVPRELGTAEVFDLDDLPPPAPKPGWRERLFGQGGGGGGGGGDGELQTLLSQRVCGSPAVDGYAHVTPRCLVESPAAQWWNKTNPKPEDLDIHLERHADYDGLAVRWGIGHKKASLEECGEACRQHVPKGDGPYGWLPCNAFAWCGEETCWEPDAHEHHKGDCWLKFTEGPANPEVNMRGRIVGEQRKRHPGAPDWVPWHAGVLLPHGVDLRNGTWSPRYLW